MVHRSFYIEAIKPERERENMELKYKITLAKNSNEYITTNLNYLYAN